MLAFSGSQPSRFRPSRFANVRQGFNDSGSSMQQQQQSGLNDGDNFVKTTVEDDVAKTRHKMLYGETDTDDNTKAPGSLESDDVIERRSRHGSLSISGSILIRNARRLDSTAAYGAAGGGNKRTTGSGSRLVDIVERTDDPSDTFIVEENANLFDGSYFQTRQNPMYSSDHDLHHDDNPFQMSSDQTSGKDSSHCDFKTSSTSKDCRSDTLELFDSDTSSGDGGGSCKYDVTSLLCDAPPDSIRQKISVDREEETVEGPLSPDDELLLNSDAVSENVDLDLVDGQVHVTVCVRCERTVPLYSMQSVYKKSSVIVTRRIEIDMDCTATRRQLYDMLQRRQRGNSVVQDGASQLRLSAKETFQLYKGFIGLVEANEAARVASLKPQPGSILNDDIFNAPLPRSSRSSSVVNGTASTTSRLGRQTSQDLPSASDWLSKKMAADSSQDSSPYHRQSSGIASDGSMTAPSYLDDVISTDDYSSPFVSDDHVTSYSTSITSSPYNRYDYTPTSENSTTPSYLDRLANWSRASAKPDVVTDHVASRPVMSAYDRYKNLSPYSTAAADDGNAANTGGDGVDSSSTSQRPTSRYERIMSARTKSPSYRAGDNRTYFTPAFSHDENGDRFSESNRESEAEKLNSWSSSRYNSLPRATPYDEAPTTTSYFSDYSEFDGAGTDSYQRSTLPARLSNRGSNGTGSTSVRSAFASDNGSSSRNPYSRSSVSDTDSGNGVQSDVSRLLSKYSYLNANNGESNRAAASSSSNGIGNGSESTSNSIQSARSRIRSRSRSPASSLAQRRLATFDDTHYNNTINNNYNNNHDDYKPFSTYRQTYTGVDAPTTSNDLAELSSSIASYQRKYSLPGGSSDYTFTTDRITTSNHYDDYPTSTTNHYSETVSDDHRSPRISSDAVDVIPASTDETMITSYDLRQFSNVSQPVVSYVSADDNFDTMKPVADAINAAMTSLNHTTPIGRQETVSVDTIPDPCVTDNGLQTKLGNLSDVRQSESEIINGTAAGFSTSPRLLQQQQQQSSAASPRRGTASGETPNSVSPQVELSTPVRRLSSSYNALSSSTTSEEAAPSNASATDPPLSAPAAAAPATATVSGSTSRRNSASSSSSSSLSGGRAALPTAPRGATNTSSYARPTSASSSRTGSQGVKDANVNANTSAPVTARSVQSRTGSSHAQRDSSVGSDSGQRSASTHSNHPLASRQNSNGATSSRAGRPPSASSVGPVSSSSSSERRGSSSSLSSNPAATSKSSPGSGAKTAVSSAASTTGTAPAAFRLRSAAAPNRDLPLPPPAARTRTMSGSSGRAGSTEKLTTSSTSGQQPRNSSATGTTPTAAATTSRRTVTSRSSTPTSTATSGGGRRTPTVSTPAATSHSRTGPPVLSSKPPVAASTGTPVRPLSEAATRPFRSRTGSTS